MRDRRPIGVFDSGIGGITVLRELLRQFPRESFVYLGDTARLPYGSKSPQTIRKYVQQNLDFLIRKKVKCVIVACNSASTVVNFARYKSRPVLNVIDPGCRAAFKLSQKKRIGILATRATVQSEAYPHRIKKIWKRAFVIQEPAPLLVPLVEEGWVQSPLTLKVVKIYVKPLLKAKVDSIVLGCTHFPILRSVIHKAVGGRVQLIDSSQAIAADLAQLLKREGPETSGSASRTLDIFLTDDSPTFRSLTQKLIRPYRVRRFSVCQIQK